MMRTTKGAPRRGRTAGIVVGGLVVLALAVLASIALSRLFRRDVVVTTSRPPLPLPAHRDTSPARVGTAGRRRDATPRPRLTATTPGAFEGCPVEGDGGDRTLNRLKNREAGATPDDMPFDSVLTLDWPEGLGGRARARWPADAIRRVTRDEQRLVRVEGYVARARLSGPESTNCHGEKPRFRDYHVWLTGAPGADRSRSVIAEMTPRFRARHPGWNLRRLGEVSRRADRIRVTGWLLLDQEHPEQIGRTRGTIWEIHPVTAFDVRQGGRWMPLDSVRETRGERR